MKATDTFTQIITDHLNGRAAGDPLFAETLKKPNKNIEGCIAYILNTVKASGKNGFADEEIFGMAVHYYDEDDIKPGQALKNTKVIVNRVPELTREEVEAAKKEAYDSVVKKETDRLLHKQSKPKPAKQNIPSLSLFD